MKLKEWNWEKESYVEVEYPDDLIKGFVDWFRNNKQWRERGPDASEMVFHRWRTFESRLNDIRNEKALTGAADVPVACTKTTKAGNPCKNTTGVVNGVCAVHRRSLVPA